MHQSSLFAIRVIPDGLIFNQDFLSLEEQRELLTAIEGLPFHEFKLHGVAAKRRVMHFGFRYALERRVLSDAPDLPAELEPIRARAATIAGVAPADFSQILINEYFPGAGIGWHRDSPPFGIVAGISLGADCTMRFQTGSAEQRRTAEVELPSRSMYLLTGTRVRCGSIGSPR